MTLLLSDNFTDGIPSASWSEAYFQSSNYAPTTTAQRYVTTPAPPLGGTAAHSFIPVGTNETLPCRFQKDGSYTERYLEFRMFFGNNFFYPGGMKIARFGNGTGVGSTAFFEYNNPGTIVWYVYELPVNGLSYVGNISYTFPENTWIKIGIHFKESSVSTANGLFRLYVDDDLLIDSGNIVTRTTSAVKDYWWLGGNNSWGGGTGEGGGTVASGNSSLYYANVRLYDEFLDSPDPDPDPDPGPGDGGEPPILYGNYSTRALQVDFLMSGLIDTSGNPLSGGKVWSYAAGTTTKKRLFLDQAMTTVAENPVILSSRGQALVYGEGAYDFKIENSNGVLQSSIANVIYSYPDDGTIYCGASTGSSNTYTLSPTPALTALTDGMILTFVANFANTGAVDIVPSNLGTYDLVRNDGTTPLTTGDITNEMLVDIRYVALSNHFRLVSQSGVLGLSSGGTGAASAIAARVNLGLGTLATQNANAVAITGGDITGVTCSGFSSKDAVSNISFGIGGTYKWEIPVGTVEGSSMMSPTIDNWWVIGTGGLAPKQIYSHKFILRNAPDYPNAFSFPTGTVRRTLDTGVATVSQVAEAHNTLVRDLVAAGLLGATISWT
jgi:hypothetical protein